MIFFTTTILKSLVVPVIGATYSRIVPFFALNRIFFPANDEATLKTKQPITFQGLFKVTNQIVGKWKTEYHEANFATFVSKKKMDEFIFKPALYYINKIF